MGAQASSVAMANAITGISYSLKELKRVDEALTVIDGAIDLLREGNYPFVVDTLRTKARWQVEIHEYDEAITTYLEAIQVNEIDGEREFYARDLFAISVCYSMLKRWPEVIEHAYKARENFKAEKLVDEVSWCDSQIALAYAELGNIEFALDIGQRAYNVAELRQNLLIKCSAALAIGKAQVLGSKYDDAESRFFEARQIASGSNDWETIISIEKEFVNLYLVQGKTEEAAKVEKRLKSLQEIVE